MEHMKSPTLENMSNRTRNMIPSSTDSIIMISLFVILFFVSFIVNFLVIAVVYKNSNKVRTIKEVAIIGPASFRRRDRDVGAERQRDRDKETDRDRMICRSRVNQYGCTQSSTT